MKKICLFIISLFLLPSLVMAIEVDPDDVLYNSYIIGTQLFTSPENDIYDTTNEPDAIFDETGVLYTRAIMFGSSTINSTQVSDMIVYYKDFFNTWGDGITGEDLDVPSSFNITHVNGICIDPACMGGAEGNVEVTFKNGNGVNFNGSPEDVVKEIKYGSVITAADIPNLDNRAGYKFTCWEKSGASDCFDFSQPINEDITLVDVWEAINYNITFDTNGGTATGVPASLTCNVLDDTCITPNVIPERDGYTFAGWGIGTESGLVGANSDMSPLLGLFSNITLKAMWNEIDYSVTYVLDGGTISTADLVKTFNVNNTTIDLVEPTRIGYTFAGWVGSTTTLGGVTVNGLEATMNSLEDVTFIAQWTPITYSVSFNLVDGTINGNSSIETLSCTYDAGCTVPGGTPVKEGYEFINWIDDVNHYVYNPGASITHITTNMSLKAQYTNEHLLNINYNLNGGTFAGNPNITFSKGTKPTLTSPTKVGYDFNCWKNGDQCVDSNATFNESISVVADWTAKKFRISYDLNGGTVANQTQFAQKNVAYDVGAKIPTAVPTLADHIFYGWTSSDGYLYQPGATVKEKLENVTLTAKYDLKEKNTINYLLNGGTFASEVITSYGDDASFALPTPTRVGYTFAGWKDGDTTYPAGTNINTINKPNLTITAQWTPITFTVSYNTNGSLTAVPDTTGCTYESCEITSTIPELEGKNFEGWYYDGYLFNTNGRHSLAGIGTIENGSTIVLTARWSNKDRYFVSYLLDGGSFAGAPVNSFYAGDSATIATPTKTGYNFGGWVISGTTTTVTSFSDLTGDTILEAQWTEKTFDIIYDKNSADATFAGTNSTGCTYSTGCVVTDVVPVWPGHTFNGWLFGGESYEAGDTIKEQDANATLVADWSTDSYAVTFNIPNDATLPDNAITTLHYGDNALPIPTRTGYTFTGWKDQDDVVYSVDNGSVVATNVTGPMTFTAQWVEKQFTLHFVIDPADSDDILPNVTKNYFETYTFDATAMGINNKDDTKYLEAWLLDGVEYQLNSTITEKEGDVYLTAKWTTRTSHSITYELDGGTLPQGAITSFYEGLAFNLPEPTKEGYIFNGWDDDNSNLVYNTTDPLTLSSDLEVTALWIKDVFNITYDLDGGALPTGESNPSTYAFSTTTSIVLVEPEPADPDNYEFAGWEQVDASTDYSISGNTITITSGTDISIKATYQPI